MKVSQYKEMKIVMKRMNALRLVLVAVLATYTVTAGSAAALQWLLTNKPLTSKVTVASTGLQVLSDLRASAWPRKCRPGRLAHERRVPGRRPQLLGDVRRERCGQRRQQQQSSDDRLAIVRVELPSLQGA
jgi:hypothetical protein